VTTAPPERLRLAPDIASARAARKWLTNRISAERTEPLVEVASLLLSELVTNAVLHAGTDIDVAVELPDAAIRVEVADRNPVHPAPKGYAPDAGTGRGLVLVEALADEWGVADAGAGKVVWFVVSEGGAGAGDTGPTVDWSDLDEWSDLDDGPEPARPGDPELVTVRIVGMPLDVLRAAQEQYDALFREFRLILERDPDESRHLPGRLIAVIDEVGHRFAGFTREQDDALQAALARGDDSIDLEYALPAEVGAASTHYDELLDEADEYCRGGTELLTLAPPPIAVAFRKWFLGEFARQAQGASPCAWADSPWA
jgi:anti-sigma regulatory factor (Ser/Thr protein kinase)